MKRKKLILLLFVSFYLCVNGVSKTLVLKTKKMNDLIAVYSFIMNEKEEIFLFSSKLAKIFKFKPDGTFDKSFCRRGEGPGEINRVFRMFHNPKKGLLYLPEFYSMAKGKITIYDSQGNHKGLLKPEISITHLDRVSKIIFLKDDSYIIVTQERVDWKPVGKFYVTQDEVLVRCFNPEGKLVSQIFKTYLDDELSNAVRYGGPRIPFVPSLLVNVTQNGQIAIGKTDENFISIYDIRGKKVKTIILDIPREKLSDELFNKKKKLLVERMTRGSNSRMVNLARNMIKLEYKPICNNQFFTAESIILSKISEEDDYGYPQKNKLIFFKWNGKKKGERSIDGLVMNHKGDKALIITYDRDGNESYKIEPGIFK